MPRSGGRGRGQGRVSSSLHPINRRGFALCVRVLADAGRRSGWRTRRRGASQPNTQIETCIQINLAIVPERAQVRAGDVAMEGEEEE